MGSAAPHSIAPVQIIRDRRDVVTGHLEDQRSDGNTIACDARYLVIGSYDRRENFTRDTRGLMVARDDVLAALLACR